MKPVPKIGTKSGKLTVVGRKGRQLACRCDCGGEKTVSVSEFQRGKVRSCGCLLNKTQPGERFGRLVVTDNYLGIAEAVCDCGRTVRVWVRDLRSHRTRSCGCLRSEKALLKSLQAVWETLRRGYGPPVWKPWSNRYGFPSFKNWAFANGWAPGKKLERIDQSRGFEPDNCCWR